MERPEAIDKEKLSLSVLYIKPNTSQKKLWWASVIGKNNIDQNSED